MERLTERTENGCAVYKHPTLEPEGWKVNRHAVLEKCCKYEESGLEPDEIPTGLEFAQIYCMQLRYKEMQKLLEQAAEEIENCYGRETELSERIRKQLNNHSAANC